jgi:hypothetical protein
MTTALQTKDRHDKRERITGRLRHALDLMIWGDQTGKPLAYDEAARAVNISTRSMRKSLERPTVRMYLQTQKQVLRACLSAKTLWRLEELGWQNENRNAAVAAIRCIEGQEEQSRSFNAESPRLTIIIRQPDPAPAPVVVEHAPPIESETDNPHDPTKRLREPRFHDPTDLDR